MTLRPNINRVGEEPLPLGVYRNSPFLVSTCSSCRKEGLFLLLHRKPTVRSSKNLERRQSFSLYFFFSLLSLSFLCFLPPISFSTEFFGPKLSGRPHLATCHSHIVSLGFPYPLIHNFGFTSYQVVTHVTHGSHLDLCLTCSPFDTWPKVSPPNECQVSLVTLGASKNMKFRLSRNSTGS